MATPGNRQHDLALRFGMQCAPRNAPASVLRQITSDGHALRVSIKAGRHKQCSLAAALGKSVGYVSRMCSGARPIPDKLVGPITAITGQNLLRQYRDLQRALEGAPCSDEALVALMRVAA